MSKIGKELEAGINAAPHLGGGVRQRASFCAHEDKLYIDTHAANRKAVLEGNKRLRQLNEGRRRDPDSLNSQMMLSVPEGDWHDLMKQYPDYLLMDGKKKKEFWLKQRSIHPEWFIG